MPYMFSRATGAVYLSQLGGVIPDDVVKIDDETYQAVFANPPPGKTVVPDKSGQPVLVDVLLPEVDPLQELISQARAWRDGEISRVSWLRDRHRDELELKGPTSITAQQYDTLMVYIQRLRDWPEADGFPHEESRPEVPDWVITQT
ncbi:phage tail protein [Pseudomonas congelans]|uniref:phage tail assembly chaperone n=1 Tax=Pseudomonas congelans TaxID=200452 RepID=UPI001BDBC271|nr:phage tail assembly chaperone [Pseudomonas congelans]QVX14449.1 phage tail protein [Pseudomonas congelans]